MRPRRITDEQILSTMRKHVLSRGPQVPLEAVAAELAVTAPALLKRFGSRQTLMLAALRPPGIPAWVEKLARGPTSEPLEAQLRAIFSDLSSFLRETLPCVMALRESGIPFDQVHPHPDAPERGRKALKNWLTRAAERGLVAPRGLDAAAYAMLGAVQARVLLSHLLQRKTSARSERPYIEELVRLFARALAPAGDAAAPRSRSKARE